MQLITLHFPTFQLNLVKPCQRALKQKVEFFSDLNSKSQLVNRKLRRRNLRVDQDYVRKQK